MAIGTTAAILAASGAVPQLISAFNGSRAANRGAQAQTDASNRAIETMNGAVNGVNPMLQEAGNTAGNQVLNVAEGGAQGVLNASQSAANGMNTAVTGANAGMQQALNQDNGYLQPYIGAGHTSVGTLGDLLSPNGRYTGMMDEKFQFDPASDPSYQFVLDQGMKAIQKSAAARGGLQGGGTMQSLAKFGAGLASQEYSNQFNRFQTDRNNRAGILNNMSNQLQNVAGMGLQAGTTAGRNQIAGAQWMGDNTMDGAQYSGNVGMQGEQFAANQRLGAQQYASGLNFNSAMQQGENSMRAAEYNGNAHMGIGNSQAAGHIGSANAWGAGINGAVNAGTNAFVMGSMLRPRGIMSNTGDPVPSSAYLPGGALAPQRKSW